MHADGQMRVSARGQHRLFKPIARRHQGSTRQHTLPVRLDNPTVDCRAEPKIIAVDDEPPLQPSIVHR
jgi:hypothetical protein